MALKKYKPILHRHAQLVTVDRSDFIKGRLRKSLTKVRRKLVVVTILVVLRVVTLVVVTNKVPCYRLETS